jgi:hypothetical protein
MIDIREKKGQKLADLNDEIQIDGAISLLHHIKSPPHNYPTKKHL